MALNTSLEPIPDDAFGPAQARHLMLRAGFGGTPRQITELQSLGLANAVDRLVDYADTPLGDLEPADLDPDVQRRPSREERMAFLKARKEKDRETLDKFRKQRVTANFEDRHMHAQLQRWWVQRMIQTPRPAEENLTLLWHNHFATRHRDIRDAYLMEQQNSFFRDNANGSFADLAAGIIRDPAMIKFLNNDKNHKRKPNENLARELMELFTLGEGYYTENDIKQGARALTGYHVDDNDFLFNKFAHDDGDKTILGKSGPINGDSFVKLLLAHEACSRYIALKLYLHFVADVPDDWDLLDSETRLVVQGLADELRRTGYELKPVLTRLFKSRHFYDAGVVGKKIKSPVQVVVGTARQAQTPMRDDRGLTLALKMMGQDLFEPPSVAGWEGGRAWINTSTLFLRQNTCTYLITGNAKGRGFKKSGLNYDPMPLLEGCGDKASAKAVTDHLCDALLGPHVPAARREPLVQFMNDRDKGVTADSVVALLLLITAMPEYQLC